MKNDKEDAQTLIDHIMRCVEYGTLPPTFDTTFVEQMQEKLEEYNSLTTGQIKALKNITKKYKI